MDPFTIVAIVSACITVASAVAGYTTEGITNAKLKANNRNQIFLSIYDNRK